MSFTLRVDGLRKVFLDGRTQRVVLDGLNLTVLPGESLAVVGPSGSGKSTLLNVLATMVRADGGTIRLTDATRTLCVEGMTEQEAARFRREHLGFVFQAFNLIPTLTAYENLGLALALRGMRSEGGAAAGVAACIDAMLATLDLAHRADAFPDELSGGEQQRVAVGRALIHNPAIVLADEPTGNLDAVHAEVVADLLFEQCVERGTTLVVATHSDRIAARATRILRLDAAH